MSRTAVFQLLIGASLGLLVLWLIQICAAPIERVRRTADVSTLPRAVVEPAAWDFGRVAAGPSLQATFRVRNAGGRRLVLHRSESSCDCLAGVEAELLVEPGASRTITAQLRTEGASGAVSADLLLRTNDPERGTLRLSCRAYVE